VLLLFNIATAFWLLGCYAASVLNPIEVEFIALLNLTLPFALIANISFGIFWIFSTHKFRFLVSLIPLMICYKMLPAIFGIHFYDQDWQPKPNHFKLLSWNVHAMGTFDHPNEIEQAKGIMNLIQEESPEILCLPEFATDADTSKWVFIPKIMNENGYHSYYFKEDNDFGPQIRIGTLLLSKFPVLDYKIHQLSKYIFMSPLDVELPTERRLSVFVVHLRSFMLSDNDKALIEEVKANNKKDIPTSFLSKLNLAYIARADEAEKVASILEKIKNPLIVCGDFNDLPFSYTYTTIRNDMGDAFSTRGLGLGRTYNQIFPTLRIDHVFYDESLLTPVAFKTIKNKFSDHNPVIVNFEYSRH